MPDLEQALRKEERDVNDPTLPIVETVDSEPILKLLENVFRLQHTLNTNTNGTNYLSGTTATGKDVDFLTCIKAEIHECLMTTPWEHWKNFHNPDINNVKLVSELVDVIHFMASYMLGFSHLSLVAHGEAVMNIIHDAAEFDKYVEQHGITAQYANDAMMYINVESEPAKTALLMSDIMDQMRSVDMGVLKSEIDKVHTQLNSELSPTKAIIAQLKYLLNFFQQPDDYIFKFIVLLAYVAKTYNFSMNFYYRLYLGKNALNKFRQDNGYKEGTYRKFWSIHDDNMHLYDYILNIPSDVKDEDITIESIYAFLNESYTAIQLETSHINTAEEALK